ncbi:hypothetical protein DL546_000264 [Coniochaeta pulveracea]|uniref:Uncharacterized protein n=1 Tax=Coniochaeta pulveracea TaxID=177199 RepID=A0A420YNH1_9PEZI|nr:hypothetical protein DL546_000264 [Coniochaeta pulveracea]
MSAPAALAASSMWAVPTTLTRRQRSYSNLLCSWGRMAAAVWKTVRGRPVATSLQGLEKGFLDGLGRRHVCLGKFTSTTIFLKHLRSIWRAAVDYTDAFRGLAPLQQLRDYIPSYMT